MDIYSFIIHIKTEDVYLDIADDIEKDLVHDIMSIGYYLQERIKK